MKTKPEHPPPWTRVVILLASLIGLSFLAHYATGEYLPSDPKTSLIFQNALLLIVLGSALIDHRFTKPADSVVNGLMGAITLLPVYGMPTKQLWWCVFLYCALVCLMAMVCVSTSSSPFPTGLRKRIADFTYKPSVFFGRSRLIFSVVFLYGAISFYGIQSEKLAVLTLFWGIFIAIWPLGLPEMLAAFGTKKQSSFVLGRVVRTDAPNIIHAELAFNTKWDRKSVKIFQQGDGTQRYVIPLFAQAKDNQILGTGLCVGEVEKAIPNLDRGCLYEVENMEQSVEELLTGDKTSKLIGFVERESRIGQLRFHTWNPMDCKEGMLVWSNVGDGKIYYQVTEGVTEEEGLESDKHGYQIAVAAQLGVLNPDKGFEKFAWLPAMNTPVFAVPEGFGKDIVRVPESDFKYGHVPGTSVSVTGAFADMLEYHTAIRRSRRQPRERRRCRRFETGSARIVRTMRPPFLELYTDSHQSQDNESLLKTL